MVAVMSMEADPTSLEEAEAGLVAWGLVCRRNTEQLGLPRQSSMYRMIEQARVFRKAPEADRGMAGQLAAVRRARRKRPTLKARVCEGCGHRFRVFRTCPSCGKRPESAHHAETRSMQPRSIQLPSKVARMDAVVSSLPRWQRDLIRRRYLHGQPDSRAAQDLRCSKDQYRRWCAAVLEAVAECLDRRLGL